MLSFYPSNKVSKKYVFIYLFLAVLGVCCFTWAFSSCGSWDYSLVVHGLLTGVSPLAADHKL